MSRLQQKQGWPKGGGAKKFFVGKLILRTMALAVFRLKPSFARYVVKTNIFSKIYIHFYIGQKKIEFFQKWRKKFFFIFDIRDMFLTQNFTLIPFLAKLFSYDPYVASYLGL